MFSAKKNEQKNQEVSRMDTFIEEIKKDMTNRAATAAKQESTINNLVEELAADRKELAADRKELRAMRKLYETRMSMDDEIIEKFMLALERRKQ